MFEGDRAALASWSPCIPALAATSAEEMLLRASSKAQQPDFDARAFRRQLNKTGRYVRQPRVGLCHRA